MVYYTTHKEGGFLHRVYDLRDYPIDVLIFLARNRKEEIVMIFQDGTRYDGFLHNLGYWPIDKADLWHLEYLVFATLPHEYFLRSFNF